MDSIGRRTGKSNSFLLEEEKRTKYLECFYSQKYNASIRIKRGGGCVHRQGYSTFIFY